MALTWSLEKVKYFKDRQDEIWFTYSKGTPDEYEDVNAETKTLLLGSMAIGIGDLTISNAAEAYARWKVLEKYDDIYLYSSYNEDNSNWEKHYVTIDIVKKHIGMFTNVGFTTKKSWLRNLHESYMKDNRMDRKPTLSEITNLYDELMKEFEESF